MPQSSAKYPGWFLWLLENGPLVIFVTGGLFLAMIGVAYYVDQRLTNLTDDVARQPPRQFQPPNLADYAADEILPESIQAGGTLYVPIYSHVYYEGGRPYALETTLSIRNTDLDGKLFIDSVRYYDTSGQLAREQVKSRIMLNPMQTIEFLIEQRDSTGGSGANFMVDWVATDAISPPIVDAVMLGTSGTQAVAFQSMGRTVKSQAQQ